MAGLHRDAVEGARAGRHDPDRARVGVREGQVAGTIDRDERGKDPRPGGGAAVTGGVPAGPPGARDRVDVAGLHRLAVEPAGAGGDHAQPAGVADDHVARAVVGDAARLDGCGGRGDPVAGQPAAAGDRVDVPRRHRLAVEGAVPGRHDPDLGRHDRLVLHVRAAPVREQQVARGVQPQLLEGAESGTGRAGRRSPARRPRTRRRRPPCRCARPASACRRRCRSVSARTLNHARACRRSCRCRDRRADRDQVARGVGPHVRAAEAAVMRDRVDVSGEHLLAVERAGTGRHDVDRARGDEQVPRGVQGWPRCRMVRPPGAAQFRVGRRPAVAPGPGHAIARLGGQPASPGVDPPDHCAVPGVQRAVGDADRAGGEREACRRPGPPTPPATVVIVPGAGPPVRAGMPGGAALPEADSHAAATPAATITAAPSARNLPCLRSRPHQPIRALLDWRTHECAQQPGPGPPVVRPGQ